MKKIILKTNIKRAKDTLYFCGTDENGYIVIGEAPLSRGGRKKKIEDKEIPVIAKEEVKEKAIEEVKEDKKDEILFVKNNIIDLIPIAKKIEETEQEKSQEELKKDEEKLTAEEIKEMEEIQKKIDELERREN